MPVEVTMPKLSDTMEEGKILKWLKHPGDRVAIGEIIAEVETNKANMELEAYDEGTLAEVRVPEGESAPVGAVIAVLAAPGEGVAKGPAAGAARPAAAAEKAAPSARAPASAPGAAAAAKAEAGREPFRPTVVRRSEPVESRGAATSVKASPLARRIAQERGLDLAQVTGTGPGGRIVQKDVEAALAERGGPPPAAAKPAAPAEPRPSAESRVELSRIRRTTAKRMGESKRELPHFYASADIRMDEAVRLKEALAGLGGEFEGITFTHLVLRALAGSWTRVPGVKAPSDGAGSLVSD